jgi:hypothetical protein
MPFPDNLGVITCRCVIERCAPVRFVSHAGGDWQMYCSDANHDFDDPAAMRRDLVTVHVAHLVALDPTLDAIADLPTDMGAERTHADAAWTRFENADDD